MILVRARILAGFKDKLDQLTKEDISKMILTKYKNLSLEELNKAFELDRHSATPIEHFQLFNSTYVAKVLENYRKWRRNAKNSFPSKFKKQELKTLSSDDVKKNREEFLKIVFDELQEKEFFHQAWLLYDDIDSPKKSDDEYKKLLFKKEFEKEKKRNKRKGFSIQNFEGSQFVKNRCKAIIVCDALKPFTHDYTIFKSKIR